jgi:hypothetical protein
MCTRTDTPDTGGNPLRTRSFQLPSAQYRKAEGILHLHRGGHFFDASLSQRSSPWQHFSPRSPTVHVCTTSAEVAVTHGDGETTCLHYASLAQKHGGAVVADDGLAALVHALLQLGERDLHLAVLHLALAREQKVAWRDSVGREETPRRAWTRSRARLPYASSTPTASQSHHSNAPLRRCRIPAVPQLWDGVGKRRHAMTGPACG